MTPTTSATHTPTPVTTGRRPTPGILLAGLIGGAATASGIALTATSGWLIVRASERPVLLTLLAAIVAVRAFGMARPYFRYVERVRSHDEALRDLATRRQRVYAALIPLTPARLGRRSRADVLTGVVDDLTDVVEAQVRVTVPVVASATSGLLAVGLTSALWPPVGLVLAGLLVVLGIGCWIAWRLESRGRDEILSARAQVMSIGDLVTRQADELRAIGGAQTAMGWLDDAHTTLRNAVRRQSHGRALVAALILAGTGVATLLAARFALDAPASGAVKALLVVVPVATGDALAPLVEAMRSLARADGSVARLEALLAQSPAVAAPGRAAPLDPTTGQPARLDPIKSADITLRGITASWTAGRTDLGPLDLDLPAGHRLAVVGANGSGKSTLLAVLARHLDPASGSYLIDGIDACAAEIDQVRAHFAVVDDEPHVFASTLRANLRVASPQAGDERLVDALARAGLANWLHGIPEGLDTRLGAGGRGLSGGERARLGIARALLSNRPAILMDEPLAHLDHATATAILADLDRIGRDRTVVMVSHRSDGLAAFDTVLDLTPTAGRRHPISTTSTSTTKGT